MTALRGTGSSHVRSYASVHARSLANRAETGGYTTERRKEGDGFRLTYQTAESVRRCCRNTAHPLQIWPSNLCRCFTQYISSHPSALRYRIECGLPFDLTRIRLCTEHAVKMRCLTDQAVDVCEAPFAENQRLNFFYLGFLRLRYTVSARWHSQGLGHMVLSSCFEASSKHRVPCHIVSRPLNPPFPKVEVNDVH